MGLQEQVPLHPIMLTRLFTAEGLLTRLKGKLLAGRMRNNISGLTSTGIPPWVMLGNELNALREQVSKQGESIHNR